MATGFVAAWAPDSRRLAYSTTHGIHVLTIAGTDRIVDRVLSTVPQPTVAPRQNSAPVGAPGSPAGLPPGNHRPAGPAPVPSTAWPAPGRPR